MTEKNMLTTQAKKSKFSDFLTAKPIMNRIGNMTINKSEQSNFVSGLISVVADNPDLQNCEHTTLFSAGLKALGLKLPLTKELGYCYIVPFKDRKKGRIVAQFQLGWKGYYQLAMRTGIYKKIILKEVKEGELKYVDHFKEEYTFEQIEDETKRQKAKTIGYYGCLIMQNGATKEIYWSKEKIEAHAQRYSQAYKGDIARKTKYSFWSIAFDEMALKTICRQILSKYGALSVGYERTDLMEGLSADTESMKETEEVEGPKEITSEVSEEPKEDKPKKTTRKPATKTEESAEEVFS